MEAVRTVVLSAVAVALLFAAVPASANDVEMPPVGLGGLVRSDAGPLDSARVYAYQVTELTLTRAVTDEHGRFLFRTLPAGVYKVIAHKVGFVPAVVLFTRATQSAADFLEFELVPERSASFEDSEDFWSIRRRIPGDVLREIELAEAAGDGASPDPDGKLEGLAFDAEMMAGLDDTAGGLAQLTRGRIGLQGRIGRMMLELDGRFDQLRPDSGSDAAAFRTEGQTNAIDVSLASATSGRSALQLHTVHHTLDRDALAGPVDFERYQVQWSKGLASGAESRVSAQYLQETGFHTQGLVKPAGLPEASRTLRVNGSYRQEISDRLALRTGVSYQEMLVDSEIGQSLPGLVRQRVNAFGIGSTELGSSFLVEYGLYSMLLDGTLAVAPHGGVVVNLSEAWQAEAVARKRFRSETPGLRAFTVAYFENLEADPSTDEEYYRVGFRRSSEDGESIRLSAIQRRIGDTVRVFFNEDFFDQIESVYLVQGDELPEIQVAVSKRLAPQIMATLASNLAAGGGGLMIASDDRPYENHVRYAVTSLDTQFQQTSTGVFLALHRVGQRLDPVAAGDSGSQVDLEKLQLKVTQQLDYFRDLGTELAVLLNVEFSRGDAAYGRDLSDDLHRRVAGGIAVRF